MKKALMILLLLAFVAGGVFAQFSITGVVNAGLGILVMNKDSYPALEDPIVGITGKNQGNAGGRADDFAEGEEGLP